MKKALLTIILLILILTACAPQPASTPAKPIVLPNATPVVASPAPTSTPRIILATATSRPQPTATPTLTESCLSLEAELPADLKLPGVWVYNPGSPYLENLAENTVYSVPLEGGGQLSTAPGDMAISPDGTHMAYIDTYLDTTYRYRTDKRVLRVIRSSGHALDLDYWLEVDDWQWIVGWVDDQNLAIATGNKDVVILNPVTGFRRTFHQPDWVNFKNDTNPYRWDVSNYPLYNPTLAWILEHPDYDEFALKNVQTGETIWQKTRSDWSSWSWTANQTTFVIQLGQAINVFENGKQTATFSLSKFGDGSFF